MTDGLRASKDEESDLLLTQLAPHEIATARTFLSNGLAAMIARAHDCLARAEMARRGFSALARALDVVGADRAAIVERYLRETSSEPSQLAKDLEQLRTRPNEVFDLPALGERAAKVATSAELAAEVTLAVALELVNLENAKDAPLAQLLELAQLDGRWSRRVWALRLLRELVRMKGAPSPSDPCAALARSLFQPSEHRWVQPAALALLAEASPDEALRAALARFATPPEGDDFLVRERLVSLAGRRGETWNELVVLAAKDPSEHVRLAAARELADVDPIILLASADKSHRVRAQALISLTQRWPQRAEAELARALAQDAHGVTVRTAAELLVSMARDKKLRSRVTAIDALSECAGRKELPHETRERIVDALLAVDVLTDPNLATICALLSDVVQKVPPGGGVRIGGPAFASATGEGLARVLSVLSQNDFSLGADRKKEGVTVYRGEPRRFAAWRALFEIAHPAPSKRQGYVHTWARSPRGALRAPPSGLAEITATRVPGERVLVDGAGGWGRSLPMMDDVMSTLSPFGKPALIVSSTGVAMVVPPDRPMKRLIARARAIVLYPQLAELRKRSLDSDEPRVQAAFAAELLTRLGVRLEWTPLTFGPKALWIPVPPQLAGAKSTNALPGAARSLIPIVAALPGRELVRDFLNYATSMHENRLPHVAAYASVLLLAMVARSVAIRRSIDRDRKAVPLVFGGWGTRGKSGTERIKAGLLQGLGYETLVKTTGCEAMFIHALPGIAAKEIFIYRPYDKATVWEQRSLLHLARRFGVHAFLWECMALQPELVNLLQSQWMHDDYSTITNAFPDHEDVQGPSGYDVASVISEFVPTNGTLYTSEDQMLPIIREKARVRGTKVHVVEHRDSDLISEEMLARFPYHEHPRNIALVAAVARGLGIAPSVAIAEMADHVVPDLGVLKTYPAIEHEGRTIEFTNGMSANERTGAWSNWVRMGFDQHDPETDPKKYIVTVVNNRGDRVARSEVFARFIVEDASAHRHVLIGSNVTGLYGFIKTALEKHLDTLALTKDLAGSKEEQRKTARARLARALRFLKIAPATADSVVMQLQSMGLPPVDVAMVSGLLFPDAPGEPATECNRIVETALSAHGPFVVEMVARRRAGRALEMAVDQWVASDPMRLERAFRESYTTLFMAGVLPLYDFSLTGDQIIDRIAKAVPVGAHAAVMGVQNIKGTGLDFVYRWVSHDLVTRAVDKLEHGSPRDKEQALSELLVHDDYGFMDAKMALARIGPLTAASPELPALAARLRDIVTRKGARLTASRVETFADRARRFIGKTFDYMHSIRRQQLAAAVVEDLVAGRISHASAAVRMRDVVASAKGQWMKKK